MTVLFLCSLRHRPVQKQIDHVLQQALTLLGPAFRWRTAAIGPARCFADSNGQQHMAFCNNAHSPTSSAVASTYCRNRVPYQAKSPRRVWPGVSPRTCKRANTEEAADTAIMHRLRPACHTGCPSIEQRHTARLLATGMRHRCPIEYPTCSVHAACSVAPQTLHWHVSFAPRVKASRPAAAVGPCGHSRIEAVGRHRRYPYALSLWSVASCTYHVVNFNIPISS